MAPTAPIDGARHFVRGGTHSHETRRHCRHQGPEDGVLLQSRPKRRRRTRRARRRMRQSPPARPQTLTHTQAAGEARVQQQQQHHQQEKKRSTVDDMRPDTRDSRVVPDSRVPCLMRSGSRITHSQAQVQGNRPPVTPFHICMRQEMGDESVYELRVNER